MNTPIRRLFGFFVVLFTQWVRASMQEARREDRRLDRLEQQQLHHGG